MEEVTNWKNAVWRLQGLIFVNLKIISLVITYLSIRSCESYANALGLFPCRDCPAYSDTGWCEGYDKYANVESYDDDVASSAVNVLSYYIGSTNDNYSCANVCPGDCKGLTWSSTYTDHTCMVTFDYMQTFFILSCITLAIEAFHNSIALMMLLISCDDIHSVPNNTWPWISIWIVLFFMFRVAVLQEYLFHPQDKIRELVNKEESYVFKLYYTMRQLPSAALTVGWACFVGDNPIQIAIAIGNVLNAFYAIFIECRKQVDRDATNPNLLRFDLEN